MLDIVILKEFDHFEYFIFTYIYMRRWFRTPQTQNLKHKTVMNIPYLLSLTLNNYFIIYKLNIN